MRKFVWKIIRLTNKTSQICQYRVYPPVASIQATQRRRILLMSLAICSWGILLHSFCKAAPKAWSALGRGTLWRTRWPMCTTESSTTKNAPSFGRSLAEGVEEDTPATDCQTHQEYASSLCGLHRCNRWIYAILTDL